MKSVKSERGSIDLIIVAVLVVALIIGLGWYFFSHQSNKPIANSSTTPVSSKATLITSEQFASTLDANGAAVSPTNTFKTDTPKIYVAISLENTKQNQRVEYTRYLNDKFVDNGSIAISKDGVKNASFAFTLKQGATHAKGTYLVKTYVNGVFESSASYTVQ